MVKRCQNEPDGRTPGEAAVDILLPDRATFCWLLDNTLQVTRGFIAANQEHRTETISIENVFVDVTEELATFW